MPFDETVSDRRNVRLLFKPAVEARKHLQLKMCALKNREPAENEEQAEFYAFKSCDLPARSPVGPILESQNAGTQPITTF